MTAPPRPGLAARGFFVSGHVLPCPLLATVGPSWAVVQRARRGRLVDGVTVPPTPHTMLKYITVATAVAAAIGFIAGTAYGAKTPVVKDLAAKLPGSKVAA